MRDAVVDTVPVEPSVRVAGRTEPHGGLHGGHAGGGAAVVKVLEAAWRAPHRRDYRERGRRAAAGWPARAPGISEAQLYALRSAWLDGRRLIGLFEHFRFRLMNARR